MNHTVTTIRWIARGLSLMIILFWGYFIAAHLFGDANLPPASLTARDSLQFAMVLLWLLGLALAWRWELAGSALALMAVFIAALINPNSVAGLGVLPPVAALLFLFCWSTSRASRDKNHAA